jgi:DNA-binding transcriptional LysR family regulator
MEPLISLAELGIGLACAPDFLVSRQLAEGSLIAILDEYVDQAGIISAVWPSSRHYSPKLRAFVDYMAEHLLPTSSPQTVSSNLVQQKRVPAGEPGRVLSVRPGV